jgi:agmatine/peptidylarginine deiminase
VTKIKKYYLCGSERKTNTSNTMKKLFSFITIIALTVVMTVQAQNRKPDWARWHYLSEEEMNTPVRNENFVETDPPTGEPRFVGEFEPMQGVMIRYPLGIPTSLVAQMSNNCHVYCITQQQNSAQNEFQNAGVNMNNVTFVNAPTDSYWVRDYGPWYIFEDRHPAIVDNRYNRPRPNDDNMSQVFANFWNIPMYGMNLEHTGGNMMEDGRGHGVSDELVFQENSNNEANVRQKMRDYLGIDPYHVTIDPQGDYIAHVDCWGKYLAPDKILIAQLPQSNSQYALYEQVANYFATTNCCWGYPYRVYRVQELGGYTLAPYTNSLILNKSVYVPLGDNASYNQQALDVYQEAMPGYEIVGVTNNDWYTSWENTDALHCRTRGVMDFNMLFVDHREVLHGEQEWQAYYPVVSKFIAYSGMELKQDSLLVYYSIDGGEYKVSHMTSTGNPDEYVGYITGYQSGSSVDYYVFGADESGHRYTQPVFAELDPHHFTVGPHASSGELVITPETLMIEAANQEIPFHIINETSEDIVIESFDVNYSFGNNKYLEINYGVLLPYTLTSGSSLEVTVGLGTIPILPKGYVEAQININTSLGVRTVMVEVLDTALDSGLYTAETVYYMQEPNLVAGVTNGNTGTNTPIEITAITEDENPTSVSYLTIEPSQELPYSLSAGENFLINFGINTNSIKDEQEPIYTEVKVHSSQNTITFGIYIDDNLLNITEISAETKLYPNPTSGQFTIEGLDVVKVDVYNLVGQKVYEAQGKTVIIDAANWNKGIYLVNITHQNGAVETKKMVVK